MIISRALFVRLTIIALAFSLKTINSQAQEQESVRFGSTEVTSGLFMLYGEGGFTGGNIALSVGSDGVAMIDNGVEAVLEILRKHVAEITDKPIDYLINTHIHGDHIGNNKTFGADGTHIISHENLRKSLVTQEDTKASALPVITFADRMTLHINGDEAKIIHAKNAHTDGDAIIYFKNANVIHTGDILFNGRFPFIDSNNGGTLSGVIAALSQIEAMSDQATQIIPGHGPLANKADVSKTIAMLKDAYALVAPMVESGKTDEEIFKSNPLAKYEDYSWGFINTKRMTEQMINAARSASAD